MPAASILSNAKLTIVSYNMSTRTGTRKTFFYRALLTTIRTSDKLVVAIAMSGVTASILPGGWIAHSRFKMAIDRDEAGIYGVTKQSGTAQLLKREESGRSRVDFCQILPVIHHASRAESINARLSRSFLWPEFHKLSLTQNMRAIIDPAFGEFLIRVGNDIEPTTGTSLIAIPTCMVIKCANEKTPGDCIIRNIYSEIDTKDNCPQYITKRAILAARNKGVDMLKSKLIALFPGEHYI